MDDYEKWIGRGDGAMGRCGCVDLSTPPPAPPLLGCGCGVHAQFLSKYLDCWYSGGGNVSDNKDGDENRVCVGVGCGLCGTRSHIVKFEKIVSAEGTDDAHFLFFHTHTLSKRLLKQKKKKTDPIPVAKVVGLWIGGLWIVDWRLEKVATRQPGPKGKFFSRSFCFVIKGNVRG